MIPSERILLWVIAEFARYAGLAEDGLITVSASTDTSETDPADERLALRRAEAVKRHLELLGMAPERILQQDMGARRLVQTPAATPEPMNRTVFLWPISRGNDFASMRVRACADYLNNHCMGLLPRDLGPTADR